MSAEMLLFALAITWLPGGVLISRLTPRGLPGRYCIVAGYSLLFGLIMVPVLMRLVSYSGFFFSLANIFIASTVLLLVGLVLPKSEMVQDFGSPIPGAGHKKQTLQRLLIVLCLALISVRLVTLGLEVGLRPVFAWDAKQHWAKQAKVFYEAGRLVPFVPLQEWLEHPGENVYTNMHPDYPITIPLLLTWVNTALGEWHDSLMNLPWLLCYVATGCIFYGQLRAIGATVGVALATSYMILSLPYLNVQVALAGYADIFLSACYLAAIAAFCSWSMRRERWQGILALFFALAGVLIKNEGFYWLLTFIPGLLLVYMPGRRTILSLGSFAIVIAVLYWLLPPGLLIAGHSIESLQLGYRNKALEPVFLSFLVHDNWHLLAYLFPVLLFSVIIFARNSLPKLLPVLTIVVSAAGLYVLIFLYTRHAYGAVNFTSLNRVALQLMPAISFVTVLLYLQLVRNGSVRGIR